MSAWWTAGDTATVKGFRAWLAAYCPPDGVIWAERCSCRTCHHWRSRDGRAGRCAMPATPATVNCGATVATDLCEQYDPRDPPASAQEALLL